MSVRSPYPQPFASWQRGAVAPAPPEVQMPESRWDPGAGGLAIGTAAARVFAQAFPFVRFPYRTQIRVFNRSGSTLAFVFNGDTPRTVGPNDSVTFNAQSGVGLVRYYTVTPSGVALVAGQVEIVEEGGLSASA